MTTRDILVGLDAHRTAETWTRRLERSANEIAYRLPTDLGQLHRAVVVEPAMPRPTD